MTAAQELAKFMAKYEPRIVRQAKQALVKLRKRTPGAIEMVYDNWNGLVIGFSPNEKPSLAIFSILMAPDHVTLCFLQGKGLPDPGKRLEGSGNVVRHIRLAGPETLDEPEIQELTSVAMERAKVRFDAMQKRKLVIKSVSKKQRPRRPAKKK
jgi:hypothetical protein